MKYVLLCGDGGSAWLRGLEFEWDEAEVLGGRFCAKEHRVAASFVLFQAALELFLLYCVYVLF